MDLKTKVDILSGLYALYDEAVAAFHPACGRGCSTCCTCNVTCTTLEGWFLLDRLAARNLPAGGRAVADGCEGRFQPAITINEMVSRCVSGEDLPEETNDPHAGPCPWLTDGDCPVYAGRPFMCRAMISIQPCRPGTQAAMPPFILSLNNVLLQYLEALDRPGATGNLVDILAFLSDDANRDAYARHLCDAFSAPLIANRSFSVLMVPPEHRRPMQPILEKVAALFAGRAANKRDRSQSGGRR
jgi:hypothetical protein